MEKIFFYSKCNLTEDGKCIRAGEEMTVQGKCTADGDCEVLEASQDQLGSKDATQIGVNMNMIGKEGTTLKFEAEMEYPLKP